MSNWHLEETYKSLIQIGISALRFVLLSNGGAVIAILALIGQLHSNDSRLVAIYGSLGYLLAGIVLGGVAHLTGYITQLILYNEEKGTPHTYFKNHQPWLYASLVLVLVGIVCFGLGAWCGVTSMLNTAAGA